MLQASELKYRELEAESVVKYEEREKESGGICFGFCFGVYLDNTAFLAERDFLAHLLVLKLFCPFLDNGWMLKEG